MESLSPIHLARLINDKPAPRGVLYLTGGGTEVLPMLLSQGGGSATLLSARIPYDAADLRSLIGRQDGSLVDARTARGLAMAAFRHALILKDYLEPGQVFGLGATSKLARFPSEREGRAHEIHAAIQTSSLTLSWTVVLPAGIDRPSEERLNSLLLLNLVARAKKVNRAVIIEHDGRSINPDEQWGDRQSIMGVDLQPLYEGRTGWVALRLGEGALESRQTPRLLLPGSFRPLHDGHLQMARTASELVGEPCDFELSLFHPEKPPLDYMIIANRLQGFPTVPGRIYFTNAPTYVEKARLFPGCRFVVGHDTAQRIIDPRFYGSLHARNDMLRELEELGARFLIFGRVDISGQFQNFTTDGLDEKPLLDFFEHCVSTVPEQRFRVDLSSTRIREQSEKPSD